jgi:hypothetical protein
VFSVKLGSILITFLLLTSPGRTCDGDYPYLQVCQDDQSCNRDGNLGFYRCEAKLSNEELNYCPIKGFSGGER